MNLSFKKIKTASRVGLIGSAVALVAVVLFHYLSKYQFYPNLFTLKLCVCGGTVLGILSGSMTLLMFRKRIPSIKDMEGTAESKLELYADTITSIYYTLFGVNVVLCVLIAFSNYYTMLLLVIILVMLMVMRYPNSLSVQVELGFDQKQAEELLDLPKFTPGQQ